MGGEWVLEDVFGAIFFKYTGGDNTWTQDTEVQATKIDQDSDKKFSESIEAVNCPGPYNDQFVAFGPPIYTSTSGREWTKRTGYLQGYKLYDIAYGDTIYVAVGSQGYVLTAIAYNEWDVKDSKTIFDQDLLHIVYADADKKWFYVFTASDTFYTSADGKSWEKKMGAPEKISSVIDLKTLTE